MADNNRIYVGFLEQGEDGTFSMNDIIGMVDLRNSSKVIKKYNLNEPTYKSGIVKSYLDYDGDEIGNDHYGNDLIAVPLDTFLKDHVHIRNSVMGRYVVMFHLLDSIRQQYSYSIGKKPFVISQIMYP